MACIGRHVGFTRRLLAPVRPRVGADDAAARANQEAGARLDGGRAQIVATATIRQTSRQGPSVDTQSGVPTRFAPIEALRSEMRVVLQILAKIAAVVVAAVATYFIVTFLLQFF
jgi:hypothetical protein